jgi:hypothetical protein
MEIFASFVMQNYSLSEKNAQISTQFFCVPYRKKTLRSKTHKSKQNLSLSLMSAFYEYLLLWDAL